MYDIITLGNATLDVLVKAKSESGHSKKQNKHQDVLHHFGEKIPINDIVFTTGGSGINSAIAFSRLGLKTAFIGCLGLDINGEILAKELKKENIEFLGRVKPGNTGYSVLIPSSHERKILTFSGVNNNLEWTDIPLSLETKWLYISSPQGETFKTAEKLVSFAKKKRIKVVFNLNIPLAKQGLKKLKPVLKKADILILNKEEAANLTDKGTIKQMLECLSNYTPGIVVITNGHESIHALSGRMIYIKHLQAIKPLDKTGAGDAFASGFIYGIIQGKDIPTSLDFGHKEALAVLSHLGSKNNLLRRL